MKSGKLKILKINENWFAYNKKTKVNIEKIPMKKRKAFLEELAKIELWCKKNM
jgi:hypothetical protein